MGFEEAPNLPSENTHVPDSSAPWLNHTPLPTDVASPPSAAMRSHESLHAHTSNGPCWWSEPTQRHAQARHCLRAGYHHSNTRCGMEGRTSASPSTSCRPPNASSVMDLRQGSPGMQTFSAVLAQHGVHQDMQGAAVGPNVCSARASFVHASTWMCCCRSPAPLAEACAVTDAQ
jgi:hypothetical protein